MAQKTLRQFSAPSNSHIPTGLTNDQGIDGFEIKTGLVNMVQASPFYRKVSEDAHAYLQNFLEVSSIIKPKGTTMDNVCLQLFPFSMVFGNTLQHAHTTAWKNGLPFRTFSMA
jgi:hypothetical protein